jgi:ATP-binding cassette subfamily B protein
MTTRAAEQRTLVAKYARIVAYALAHWPILALILVLSLALSAAAALQPWPLKILIDYALAQTPPADASTLVVAAAAASLALFAASAALDVGATWAWSALGQRMVYDLAGDLFLRMQRLSLAFHTRRPLGDSITRITGDAWCVHAVTDGMLVSPARHLFTLLSVAALAWQLDRALCLLALTAAPVLAASALYFGERLKGFERDKRAAQGRLASFVHQVLGAMPLVQAFAAAPRNRGAFDALAEDAAKASRGSVLVEDAYRAVNGLAITVGMALVLYAGGRRVLAHDLSLGSLFVFIAYLRTLETASRGLLTAYGRLRAAQASIDRVLEIMDAPPALEERPGARPPRLRARELRLRAGPAGAEGHRPGSATRGDARVGRRHRRGQEHPRGAAAAVFRSGARARAARRRRPARRAAEEPARAGLRSPAGALSPAAQRCREHRLRLRGREPRRDRGRGGGRQCA